MSNSKLICTHQYSIEKIFIFSGSYMYMYSVHLENKLRENLLEFSNSKAEDKFEVLSVCMEKRKYDQA